MILYCSCIHAEQDRLYGPGMRVHNPCKSGTTGQGARCIVCSNVKHLSGHVSEPKAKKKAKK